MFSMNRAVAVLAVLSILLGVMNKLPELRKATQFLAPSNLFELLIFMGLAASAGICEEIVFRGYLQRQFAALTKNIAAGIVASAIVFGASHLYEGPERMIIIGVFGALLGT